MGRAFTSLFLLQRIAPDHLVLRDALNENRPERTLVDIGLLKTGQVGFLLFTRLLPLEAYDIASWVSFAFPGSEQPRLIQRPVGDTGYPFSTGSALQRRT